MRATEVMTTEVVTVGPDTSVQDLAKLISDRGISGVPVVENGRLVRIVSEGDLLHRAETGRAPHRASASALVRRDPLGGGPRLHQIAWPNGPGHHDPRRDLSGRDDRSRRGRTTD